MPDQPTQLTDAATEARMRQGVRDIGESQHFTGHRTVTELLRAADYPSPPKTASDYGLDALCDVLYRSLKPIVTWLNERKAWQKDQQIKPSYAASPEEGGAVVD